MTTAAAPAILRSLPSREELDLMLAEKSLHHFVRQAWHVIEPAAPFVDNWHIGEICEHLQAVTGGEITRLLISAPPRSTKSILACVMWPAWEWLLRHGDWAGAALRYLFISYAEVLSTRDSVNCRRLISDPWYQSRWSSRFTLTGDQNEKRRFENDHRGIRIATSVGGVGTGEGGNRLVFDDPHNVQRVESDKERQAAVDFFFKTLPSRMNDPKRDAQIVTAQRTNHDDVSGNILRRCEGFVHVKVPMRYEQKRCVVTVWQETHPDCTMDPRTQEGQLMCPARAGENEVKELEERLGTYAAAAQLQQEPQMRGGNVVKEKWINIISRDLLPDFDFVIASWDMTFGSKSQGASRVSGQMWGMRGANYYIFDRVSDQMTFVETKNATKAMDAKWPMANAHYVEDKANGPAIIEDLKSAVSGLLPFSPNQYGDKMARFSAVSPLFEAGNVYVVDTLPGLKEYIGTLTSFPNVSYKDDVDATSQALIILKEKRRMLGSIPSRLPDNTLLRKAAFGSDFSASKKWGA